MDPTGNIMPWQTENVTEAPIYMDLLWAARARKAKLDWLDEQWEDGA